MASNPKNFSKNLKESKNIAIIADTTKGLDSLCASIAIKELILEFIDQKESLVSVYYEAQSPKGSNQLLDECKVYKRFGEKTLYLHLPSAKVTKVIYDLEGGFFNLGLVGYENETVEKDEINFEVKKEKYDMCVGVGFSDEKVFTKRFNEHKCCGSYFVFNKSNLKGKSLTEGVIDLYFNENVVPSRLASLSFFTYLGVKD